MRVHIKALLSAFALFTVVAPLGACRANTDTLIPTNSKVAYCTIVADPPDKASGHRIVADGHYTCDSPGADTLTITVTLMRAGSHGSWHKVTAKTYVIHGSNTTRDRAPRIRTRYIYAACFKGQVRTTVHAVELSHHAKQIFNQLSVTVHTRC